MNKELEFDGERYTTAVDKDNPLSLASIGRYKFAKQFTNGKFVLDVACGSGYGTEILCENANFVIGIDNNEKAITYCNERYKKENNQFFIKDANKTIDFPDRQFDIIVSFETIEHLTEFKSFIEECFRMLKEDGIFILATPNGEINTVKGHYHTKEFSFKELIELVDPYFTYEKFYQGKKEEISKFKRIKRKILLSLVNMDIWGIRYKIFPESYLTKQAQDIDDCNLDYQVKIYDNEQIKPRGIMLICRKK